MITLPDARTGTPDVRSAGRYLAWLARRQWRTLTVGVALGVVWMLGHASVPGVVGSTIDAGLVRRDGVALLTGAATLLGIGLFVAVSGVYRHRFAVANWIQAAMRTQHVVGHHVADDGLAVTATTTTGEAISTVANDAHRIGDLYDVMGRFFGSIVSFFAVAVVVLRIDVALGLFVLLGVPLLSASLLVVVRPLNARQAAHREAEGSLTALGADTVAGLRVMRGIGGEDQFLDRYRASSQQVRAAGVRVAGPQASLEAAHVLLPGAFVVTLTWLGARAAVGGRITAGELVALYGYAAFLRMPIATSTETLGKAVRGRVAATRVVTLLRKRPRDAGSATVPPLTMPPAGSQVTDPASGLTLTQGRLTALVSAVPDEAAAVTDRLARLDPPDAVVTTPPRIGDVPVDRLDTDQVRRRIVVSEAEPRLFTGTLREEIDPSGDRGDAQILAAIDVADAADVLTALPGGLGGRVEERGRSFSGGQRQRLALARAVLAEPEVLVLVEPTSAVDAHTEARVADRLRAARAGRTTLVTTTSPLLLDRADRVAFLSGGRVIAEGTHRDLLHTSPGYRETVTRGEEP